MLVSHSMQQVLEFCSRAVWLERGEIVMDGPALAVVKAYEEFVEELSATERRSSRGNAQDEALQREILARVLAPRDGGGDGSVTVGGVYRWHSDGLLKVTKLVFQPAAEVGRSDDLTIAITVLPGVSGTLRCRYAAVIAGEDGRWLARSISEPHEVAAQAGKGYEAALVLSPLLLSAGRYVVSVSIHEAIEPFDLVKAKRHDLVARSYSFAVAGAVDEACGSFHHPVRWVPPRTLETRGKPRC
jgi:hypothetical protein